MTNFKDIFEVGAALGAYRHIAVYFLQALVKQGAVVNLEDARREIENEMKASHTNGTYEQDVKMVDAALRAVGEFFDSVEIDRSGKDSRES
ncbi:hypothetical protein [Shinella sp.]|uniref:hypothetical protein n=1 Tax=Shinella sp. TaxID=1870904 RepID=UPI00258B806D|nr:hypothetical protein [Shinella sp.]MCW5708660.1 hypothetical protein [Shinella sp.]